MFFHLLFLSVGLVSVEPVVAVGVAVSVVLPFFAAFLFFAGYAESTGS